MMSSFEGKVVVITGAAGGIGGEIAKQFGGQGAKLSLTDVNEELLSQIAKDCKKICETCEVLTIKANLRDVDQLTKIAEKTIEKFGRVDVLINNAGVGSVNGTIAQTSAAEYDLIMDVNLKAPFFLAKVFLPHLVKTKGSVINVSSATASLSTEKVIAYATSKAALDQFTRCLARDCAPKGVRVNSINPGVTDTPLIGAMSNPSFLRVAGALMQPLGGVIKPEQIARWALWLSSAEAGPITGQNVAIDGGHLVCRGHIPDGYTLSKK